MPLICVYKLVLLLRVARFDSNTMNCKIIEKGNKGYNAMSAAGKHWKTLKLFHFFVKLWGSKTKEDAAE